MNSVTGRLLVCFQVKCHHYWPSEGSRLYGVILVELIEEGSFGDYISRKFKLTHTEVCHTGIRNIGMYCVLKKSSGDAYAEDIIL